jgi:predicted nucleic acid-binding protein
MYLLDTNVLSELTAARPSEAVLGWVLNQDQAELYVSVISIGELRFGVERLPAGSKRVKLQRALDEWVIEFKRRILDFDLDTVWVWGKLLRDAETKRKTMPRVHAMLAATAELHGLVLVTRNTKDFEGWSGSLLNPWKPQPPSHS